MKIIKLERDIRVFYIQATSFPEGVFEAFQKMHSLIEIPPQRRSFGISKMENGQIVYRAAAEELTAGDLRKHQLAEFIIPAGNYIGLEIKNFRKNLSAIKKAFEQLISQPGIDPNSWCIEEYTGADDVFCMARLKY